MVDAVNKLHADGRTPGPMGRAKVKECEQVIDSLNYFTESDWQFLCDKTKLVPMKLSKLAFRLRQWGVRHLAQRSRKIPIGILLHCHYGEVRPQNAVGSQLPPGVTYQELYDWIVQTSQAYQERLPRGVPDRGLHSEVRR